MDHPLFMESFIKDKDRNKQWNEFLKKMKKSDSLVFEDVMKLITSKLRPIYELLSNV